MKHFGTYYEITKKPLFVWGVGILAAAAYLIDDYIMADRPQAIHIINYLSSILTAMGLLLYALNRIDHWKAISVYTIVFAANLITAPFFDYTLNGFSEFIMRNTYFYSVIIPVIGLIWGLRSMIISAVILAIQLIIISNLSQDAFLLNSLVTILIVLTLYTFITYTLLTSMTTFMSNQASLIAQLEKQADEMDKSNATKSKLLSIIGHDLRTPLMALTNLSFFIDDEANKSENDTLKEYSAMLERTTESTTILINNLLEWSRTQTGSFVMRPAKLNLNDEIDKALELCNPGIKAKKIQVQKRIEVDEMVADMNSLDVMLRNLITNAVKFSNECDPLFISVSEGEDSIDIEIKDEGVGMSAEKVAKLLDNKDFNSSTGTADEKGSGIGFNLCLELMDLHYGKVEVHSKEGEGTSVLLRFPKDLPEGEQI
jgi:signal transduction histidine kinase